MIVVRRSGLRLNKSLLFIQGLPFLRVCRAYSQTHFTRKRKLSLDHLILSIFNRTGATLSMELRRLFKLISPKKTDAISKPGYLKQRLKLNPWAFMTLSDFHVSNFYAEEKDLMKFKDHFVFAVDGSLPFKFTKHKGKRGFLWLSGEWSQSSGSGGNFLSL